METLFISVFLKEVKYSNKAVYVFTIATHTSWVILNNRVLWYSWKEKKTAVLTVLV